MKFAAVIAALLLGVALVWGAGEFHDRNCVDAAKARHPQTVEVTVPGDPREPGIRSTRESPGLGVSEAVVKKPNAARRRAVEGCSRLPF